MSNQKSGTYVSLTDDHQEKEFAAEEPTQDSGFISSSSVFLSSADLEEDEAKTTNTNTHPSTSSSSASFDLTTNNSQHHSSNNNDDKHSTNLKEKQLESSYLDSGLIADEEFSDEEEEIVKQQTTKSEMLVDKGINEWMCDRSSAIDNNLDSCNDLPAKPALAPRPPPMEAIKHMPLWKVCYTQDEEGDTQLHLAIMAKNYPQAVWTIIQIAPNHCLLDIRNLDGHCALHLAVLTSQPTVIRQLRIAGAQSSLRDRHGNSPLHLACINSDVSCVQALTSPLTVEEKQSFQYANHISVTGADLELRNFNGENCVHIAAIRNDIDILKQLVISGANINVREARSGYTALHYACEMGHESLTRYIVSECKQLDIETCSYGRLTAYQLAAYTQNRVLMNILQQHGAELISPPVSDDDSYSEDDDDEDDQDDDDMPTTTTTTTSNASLLAMSSTTQNHNHPIPQCS